MNHKPSTHPVHRTGFALRAVAVAALAVACSGSWALGLGRMAVQSALGENLRAEIDVTNITPEEAASLRVRVAPPEAYRAAGVDYGAVLPGTVITLANRADGRPYLRVSSDRVVQEPFVDVILELTWASGRLVREYTMLLDPPSTRTAVTPAPAPASPVISAAPAPAPSTATAPRPAPEQAPRAASPAAPAARTAHGGGACRAKAIGPGRGDWRRIPRERRRYAVTHRCAHAAYGCFARSDARRAVAQQLAGVHRQQHESAEGGRGADRAVRRRGQGNRRRRGQAVDPGAERRFRGLPPAPGQRCAGCQDQRTCAAGDRQGPGQGRRQEGTDCGQPGPAHPVAGWREGWRRSQQGLQGSRNEGAVRARGRVGAQRRRLEEAQGRHRVGRIEAASDSGRAGETRSG